MFKRKGIAALAAVAALVAGLVPAVAHADPPRVRRCEDSEGRLITHTDSWADMYKTAGQWDKEAQGHMGVNLNSDSKLSTQNNSFAWDDVSLPDDVTPTLSHYCAVVNMNLYDLYNDKYIHKRTFVLPLTGVKDKRVTNWRSSEDRDKWEASAENPVDGANDTSGSKMWFYLYASTPNFPRNLFRDVHHSDWFYNAVWHMNDEHIMSGHAGWFWPNQATTRAQAATLLYRQAHFPAAGASVHYRDSIPGYAATAVRWATNKGIMTGYGNGRFGANDPLTREQAAKIIAKAAGYTDPTLSRDDVAKFNHLIRADLTNPALRKYCEWAYREHLINGFGGRDFDPRGHVSRGQMAQIVWNCMENGII